MKIVDSTNHKIFELGDVSFGVVIKYKDNLYMVTSQYDDYKQTQMVVNLDNGDVENFNPKTVVEVIEGAELRI